MRVGNQGTASHVERLMFLIDECVRNPEERDWTKAAVPYQPSNQEATRFSNDTGIYAIIRLFRSKEKLHSRVLYIGISHTQGFEGKTLQSFP